MKKFPKNELLKLEVLEELRPLTDSLIHILNGHELINSFEAQEKIRIEKTLGKNGRKILHKFITDKALEDQDLYQILVEQILHLINKYKPQASFATYVTKYLRWKLVELIRSKTQYKSYVILSLEDQYIQQYDIFVVYNNLKTWEQQLLQCVIDEKSVRDMEQLTLQPKSMFHTEINLLRSKFL